MANGNAAELSDLAEDQDTVQPLPAKGRRSSVGSHRSSTDSMHKDDEDAIQPNVAHEWASTEVRKQAPVCHCVGSGGSNGLSCTEPRNLRVLPPKLQTSLSGVERSVEFFRLEEIIFPRAF